MEDSTGADAYGTFHGSPHEVALLLQQQQLSTHRKPLWKRIARKSWLLGCCLLATSALFLLMGNDRYWSSDDEEISEISLIHSSNWQPPPSKVQTMRVTMQNGLPRVEIDVQELGEDAHAFARFNDSLEAVGWSKLWIKTSSVDPLSYEIDDVEQLRELREVYFAAGYAEGALTHHRIDQHFKNVYDHFFADPEDQEIADSVRAFLRQNIDWVRDKADFFSQEPNLELAAATYWQTAGNILSQFDGLVAGYRNYSNDSEPISDVDMFMLNADGDLDDLINAVLLQTENGAVKLNERMNRNKKKADFYSFMRNFKCTALIRILPGFEDVVWGHTTWDTYSSMNRIFKHYQVPVIMDDGDIVKRHVSMSSSPGYLSSVDDFYLSDRGLSIMETTNGVFDDSLYQMVTPASVLCWMRSKLANLLAVDGPSWADTFAMHNSGTYNNQWMIIDMNKFVMGKGFEKDGLTLAEQMPGIVEVDDVSDIVNAQGYWGSYNVPFFNSTYHRSGHYDLFVASDRSPDFSYHECPRARILQRDAPRIYTYDAFKKMMRYNNWQHDPYSFKHPSRAIASRYDLESDPEMFALNGAIDAKVTHLAQARQMQCEAINGPTHENNNPVFEWNQKFSKLCPNRGHPRVFNFTYEPMRHYDHN